jgi:hypothetical protein
VATRAEEQVAAGSDACPYRRPFPAEFRDCVAFSRRDFTGLDLRYRPLRTVISCRHLVAGENPEGGWYPRCAIGDANARRRWVAQVGFDRLERIRAIGSDYRAWAGRRMPDLVALKGRWLELRETGDSDGARKVAKELKERMARLVADANGWIDARAAQFGTAGLPAELLKELVVAATDDWLESASPASSYRIPDGLLQKFPTAVQVFFTAPRPDGRG